MDPTEPVLPGEGERRTRMANERTYLAWTRTSLGAFAVAIGLAKVAPALAKKGHWLYTAMGAGYAVLGMTFALYGWHRHRSVEAAIRRGGYVPASGRLLIAISAGAAIVGVLTFLLLAVA